MAYNVLTEGSIMIEVKEEFKVRLQKALNARNMKPIDLANRTGLSESLISQYRSGYSKPKSMRLTIIADALGVSPAWLMGLDVPMEALKAQTRDLNAYEQELLSYFDNLNDTGKIEALKRVRELTEINRYRLLSRAVAEYETMIEELKKG